MDEGVWVMATAIRDYLDQTQKTLDWFHRSFRFEEDAGKIRLIRGNRNYEVIRLLALLDARLDAEGYVIAGAEEPKKLRLELIKFVCMSCGKTLGTVRINGAASFCYFCLSEMVIFYEMEKEKRDSRAEKVPANDPYRLPNWSDLTDKGIVRDDWV